MRAECAPPAGEEMLKRAYRRLMQSWMRDIVHDPEAEAAKRERQLASLKRQRAQAAGRAAEEAAALAARRAADMEVRPGAKGFRRHAYIPAVAKLDYVTNPRAAPGLDAAAAAAAARRGRGGGGGDEDEEHDGGFGAMAAVAREPGAARRGERGGGGGGGSVDPLTARMREQQRARKGSLARAAKVSVEGRNIAMM